MDDLKSELAELKGFIADLKADRAAQKEKEKKEAWTKHTSMSVVFVAVLAAIATQWAGKYSSRVLVNLNDATFQQAKASDEWSYYQAKSIKGNIYEIERDRIKAALADGGGRSADLDAANSKIAKYEQDKKDIQNKAKGLEEMRDRSREAATLASEHGGRMGLAVSIFQISVAVASICLVTKKKPLWYISLALAAAATGEMIFAWAR